MLTEDIKQLIENTAPKGSKITIPTELDVALLPTLSFALYITKPKEDSLLHHMRVDIPPIVRSFNE